MGRARGRKVRGWGRTGGLLVFVDNLSLRGPRQSPLKAAEPAVRLDVRFDLYGYLRLEVS